MNKITEAQKKAQQKYDEKFPKIFFRIDRNTYDRLTNLSKQTDVPVKDIVILSICEYLDRRDISWIEKLLAKKRTKLKS